jgi:hypothetical protein
MKKLLILIWITKQNKIKFETQNLENNQVSKFLLGELVFSNIYRLVGTKKEFINNQFNRINELVNNKGYFSI